MARLTLSLLAGFQVRLDLGPPLALPAKAQALLAYLALSAGQAQPREKLGALLWGNTGDEQARSNLRHALFTIRKALGSAAPPALVSEGQMVTLALAAFDVDVQQFEALAREGTPEALARAAALYQGDLLDGLGVDEPLFEEWLVTERERLRELALDALARLLAHETKAGVSQRAIRTAKRLLALDPLQEAVHRTLIRLYARQGRRAAALKQYQICVEVLRRELGAEVEPPTRQLYLELTASRDTTVTGIDVATTTAPSHDDARLRGGAVSTTPHVEAYPPGGSEGERRLVTVLFANLGGSLDGIVGRDQEDASRLVDPLLEMMVQIVRRFGGTATTVLGDGIVALFGAPRAQEDHTVRACYAALSLRETVTRSLRDVRSAHGVDVGVRVGLNSGEVMLRTLDGDLRADYSAMSQVMRLAAQIEGVVTAETIRLTAESRRLLEGYVDLRSWRRVTGPEGREPAEIFEVTGVSGARTHFHVAARRGLSRFVGRAGELAQLARAADAAWTGHGRIVAVIGEAGVGKSRLLHEMALAERVRGWRMLEAGGVTYGAMMSYLPVIALLKSYLGVEDRDPPPDVADKLRRALLALDASLEPVVPALAALLDAPVEDREWALLDPAQRRRRTLDAVAQLLLRASQERPLMLLFEDLQWIDGETQAVLDGLANRVPAVPLLVVVTYRPEYRHGWAGKAQYAQLRLDNLPAPEANQMLQALLGEDVSLESLTPMLAARAGGNPLFLEESVRDLVETGALAGKRGAYRLVTGVDAVRVPATVQAVLAARIGRQPAADRSLLQTAAVIGEEVPCALLRAVVDVPDEDLREALCRLQDAELLHETHLFPDAEYGFKHALTHEVAYRSVPQDRRRALHAGIVAALERLHAGRLAEHVERLAHHSLKGEMWEPAVRYLRQAGAKSAERHAASEASLWFEQALGALTNLPRTASTLEQAVDIRLERMPMVTLMADYRLAHEHLREVERLAEDLRDDRRRGRVYRFKVNLCNHLHQLDDAVAWGTRALEIAGRLDDLRLRAATTTNLEQTYFLRGEYERVIDLAKTNLAAVPADAVYQPREGLIPTSVYDRGWLVWSLAEVGRFVEAEEPAATALRIADQTQQPFAIGWACYCWGNLNLGRGDWVVARRLYERSIETLQGAGVRHMVPDVMTTLAWALTGLGEFATASDLAQKTAPLLERAHAQWRRAGIAWGYVWLGHTYAHLGRFDDAEAVVPRVLEPRTARFEAFASHLRGEIARRRGTGPSATAEEHYQRGLAVAAGCGMRPLIAHCHLGLGKLDRGRGKHEQAHEHLTSAVALYREMDMRSWLEKTEAEMRASP